MRIMQMEDKKSEQASGQTYLHTATVKNELGDSG